VPVPQRPSLILTELSPTHACDGDAMLAIGYYRTSACAPMRIT